MLQTTTAITGRSTLIKNPELLYYVITSMFYINKINTLTTFIHNSTNYCTILIL